MSMKFVPEKKGESIDELKKWEEAMIVRAMSGGGVFPLCLYSHAVRVDNDGNFRLRRVFPIPDTDREGLLGEKGGIGCKAKVVSRKRRWGCLWAGTSQNPGDGCAGRGG